MGCDIHLYIEKRLSKNHKWKLDEEHDFFEGDDYYPPNLNRSLLTSRSYMLFGAMAGVRGSNALYPRRGIPDDCNELIKKEAQYPDWHSHSYLSVDELEHCLIAIGSSKEWLENATRKNSKELVISTHNNGWADLLRNAKQWIDHNKAESTLLDLGYSPEVRFIFWFDN